MFAAIAGEKKLGIIKAAKVQTTVYLCKIHSSHDIITVFFFFPNIL